MYLLFFLFLPFGLSIEGKKKPWSGYVFAVWVPLGKFPLISCSRDTGVTGNLPKHSFLRHLSRWIGVPIKRLLLTFCSRNLTCNFSFFILVSQILSVFRRTWSDQPLFSMERPIRQSIYIQTPHREQWGSVRVHSEYRSGHWSVIRPLNGEQWTEVLLSRWMRIMESTTCEKGLRWYTDLPI